MRIKIVTDTSSGLSIENCEKLGYSLIGLPFSLDGDEYDDFNINKCDFYKKIGLAEKISTSQASIERVTLLFDKLLEDYDQILYFPITSGLSSAFSTGCMLENEEKYKGKVFCVNHRTISVAQRAMLKDAQNLIDKGLDAKEIKEIIENDVNNSIWLTTETLEFLRKGGRLNTLTAAIGNLLNIKPILYSDGDKFSLFRKERNINKALEAMKELMMGEIEDIFDEYNDSKIAIGLAYTDSNDIVLRFEDSLREISDKYKCDYYIDELPSVIVCHTGPSSIGIALYSMRNKK